MTGRPCSACHTRFPPEGFYWRTNASGNRSVVSSKCRRCFSHDQRDYRKALYKVLSAKRKAQKEQRRFAAYDHATLLVVNRSLPFGTMRFRQVLAGGGFVHLTEYHPSVPGVSFAPAWTRRF